MLLAFFFILQAFLATILFLLLPISIFPIVSSFLTQAFIVAILVIKPSFWQLIEVFVVNLVFSFPNSLIILVTCSI